MRGLFRKQRQRKDGVVKERGVYRPRFKSRGGVTRIIRDNYGLKDAYQALIQEVLERDNRMCIDCGSNKNLQVHHLIPLSKGGKSEKANLGTLCGVCHEARHPHLAMGK